MSEKVIDIASQSSLDEINLDSNADISPMILNHTTTIDNMVEVGSIPDNAESCAIINYNDSIYVLPDGGGSVYKLTNGVEPWLKVFDSPTVIDIQNSRFVVYEDPLSNNVEMHFIGGKGKLSRVHYKYGKENGISIASELPFDFCSGRAIVYRDEIHIFGTNSEHYKWNGIGWESVTHLPIIASGFTPFVYNSTLYLIGGTKICRFSSNNSSWDESELNITSEIVNASVVTTESNPIIIGGDNDTAIKLNMDSDLDSITIDNIEIPHGSCTSSQGAVYANTKVYVNIDNYIFINNKDISSVWVKYKSTSISMEDGIVFKKLNSLGVETTFISSIGSKKLVDVDTETTETLNFALSDHIATNDNGDIYMFLSPVSDTTNILIYEKGVSGYTLKTGIESQLKFDNYEVAWFKGLFHFITDKSGYNHFTFDKIGGTHGIQTPSIFTGTLNSSSRLNSICVYDDKLYIASMNGSNVELMVYSGAYWNTSIPATNIDGDVKEISLVDYNGNLNLIVLVSSSTGMRMQHYICADKLLLLNDIDVDWQYMNVINDTDGIQIICTDVTGLTNRFLYKSGVSESSDCEIMTVNLTKGRGILCNKNRVFPINGNVKTISNGYSALESGAFSFAIFNTENNIPFTLI